MRKIVAQSPIRYSCGDPRADPGKLVFSARGKSLENASLPFCQVVRNSKRSNVPARTEPDAHSAPPPENQVPGDRLVGTVPRSSGSLCPSAQPSLVGKRLLQSVGCAGVRDVPASDRSPPYPEATPQNSRSPDGHRKLPRSLLRPLVCNLDDRAALTKASRNAIGGKSGSSTRSNSPTSMRPATGRCLVKNCIASDSREIACP